MHKDREKLNNDCKKIEEDMQRGLLSYVPSTFRDGQIAKFLTQLYKGK